MTRLYVRESQVQELPAPLVQLLGITPSHPLAPTHRRSHLGQNLPEPCAIVSSSMLGKTLPGRQELGRCISGLTEHNVGRPLHVERFRSHLPEISIVFEAQATLACKAPPRIRRHYLDKVSHLTCKGSGLQ